MTSCGLVIVLIRRWPDSTSGCSMMTTWKSTLISGGVVKLKSWVQPCRTFVAHCDALFANFATWGMACWVKATRQSSALGWRWAASHHVAFGLRHTVFGANSDDSMVVYDGLRLSMMLHMLQRCCRSYKSVGYYELDRYAHIRPRYYTDYLTFCLCGYVMDQAIQKK